MLPKICITFVFHWSPGYYYRPMKIENNAFMQNFREQISCIMGDVQVAYGEYPQKQRPQLGQGKS